MCGVERFVDRNNEGGSFLTVKFRKKLGMRKICRYCKVASSNRSRIKAHAVFF